MAARRAGCGCAPLQVVIWLVVTAFPDFMVPLVWRATHAPRFSARRLSQLDLWSRGGATSGAQRYQDIVPREANLSDARGFDASANRAPSIGRRTMRK